MPYDPLDFDDEMPFGKYAGDRISDIIDDDARYLLWLMSEKGPGFFTDGVERELRKYER